MSRIKPPIPMKPMTPQQLSPAQVTAGLSLVSQVPALYEQLLDKFAYKVAYHIHNLEKETKQNVQLQSTSTETR